MDKIHFKTDLILDVESDNENDDDGVIVSIQFRICHDGVDGAEQESRRRGAHHAHWVPESHELLGRRWRHLGYVAHRVPDREVRDENFTESGQSGAEAQVAKVDDRCRDLTNKDWNPIS